MAKELVKKAVDIKGKVVEFTYIKTKDAVVVLPVLEDGRIVLIKQFRHAVDQELFELPAGGIEQGEEPEPAAIRELREETGYGADSITPMVTFYPSPGLTTEKMYLFLAQVSQQEEQDLDDGEEIEIYHYSLSEALEMIQTGQIKDGKTVVGLLLYKSTLQNSV